MLADVVDSRLDQPVYGLAFHVDYWNRLGWEDRFSHQRFTQRQRWYARTWQEKRIYTPQMIINGRSGFVGSRRQQAEEGVDRALQTPATATVRLQMETQVAESQVSASYHVTATDRQAVLNLALIEDGLESRVASGENAGRTLRHAGVVRGFRVVSLAKSAAGNVSIRLPPDAQLARCRVIAYVQHPQSLHILGATESGPLEN